MIPEPKANCAGCKRRSPGCHSICKEYLEFFERRKKWLDQKRDAYQADEMVIEGKTKSIRRQHREARKIWGRLK